MKIRSSFIIDDHAFSREELLDHAGKKLSSGYPEAWVADFWRFIIEFFNEDISLVQKTSGTTGDPKVIKLSREAMIRSAEMTINYFNLKPGDTALLCLPIQYIAGKMMVVRTLVGGMNLITVEPSTRPVEALGRSIGFGAMVPLQVAESLAHGKGMLNIKQLLVGGGEIAHQLRSKIEVVRGTDIYETFAMSETYTHFAIRKINGTDPGRYFEIMDGVTVGKDERDCLLVDIPGVTEGKIITNDMVRFIDDTKFEWLGRVDNVIKSGGVKLIPELLEQRLREIIGLDLVLVGIDDPKLGQKMVLVVENKAPNSPVDNWKKEISKRFEKYEIPKEIVVLPEIPRNRAMKFDRIALRRTLGGN